MFLLHKLQMMLPPAVSIITPSTHRRKEFNDRCIQFVQNQDYPNLIEHLFDYSDYPIGVKRNRLCHQSKGNIIIHADSDDMYAKDWVSKSVQALLSSGANCVGLKDIYYWDGNKMRQYTAAAEIDGKKVQKYICGATLCYYRSVWVSVPFKNTSIGEYSTFITKCGKVHQHGYIDGFCATLHSDNTSSNQNLHAKEFSFVPDDKIDMILSNF